MNVADSSQRKIWLQRQVEPRSFNQITAWPHVDRIQPFSGGVSKGTQLFGGVCHGKGLRLASVLHSAVNMILPLGVTRTEPPTGAKTQRLKRAKQTLHLDSQTEKPTDLLGYVFLNGVPFWASKATQEVYRQVP